jgi:hypothetical protein
MNHSSICLALLAVGCGSSSGGADAPTAPSMITISGTVSERTTNGSMPLPGAMVGAYKNSDEATSVATATSDAMGKYTLTVTSNGVALDGFVKATMSGYVDVYLYPPAPLTADFAGASVNILSTNTFNLLKAIGQEHAGNGVIALEVMDSTMMVVAGAGVTSSPPAAKTGYTGSNGLPDTAATVTAADGIAYLWDVPPGAATLTATKSGTTFKPTTLKIHADVLTTTIIQP